MVFLPCSLPQHFINGHDPLDLCDQAGIESNFIHPVDDLPRGIRRYGRVVDHDRIDSDDHQIAGDGGMLLDQGSERGFGRIAAVPVKPSFDFDGLVNDRQTGGREQMFEMNFMFAKDLRQPSVAHGKTRSPRRLPIRLTCGSCGIARLGPRCIYAPPMYAPTRKCAKYMEPVLRAPPLNCGIETLH
jgi:hypothetical protein